jgi:hypothetical protein
VPAPRRSLAATCFLRQVRWTWRTSSSRATSARRLARNVGQARWWAMTASAMAAAGSGSPRSTMAVIYCHSAVTHSS